ncbi:cadherin-related family member 5-like [Polypterus senegalus]|uniref:cadherin-related family member 5-like n=1 Tax=Polypterus senegalus TaxID=55291 RepID=UPI001965EAE9|nr:cadherin-related family member 5-like [Polypterus senegalus]
MTVTSEGRGVWLAILGALLAGVGAQQNLCWINNAGAQYVTEIMENNKIGDAVVNISVADSNVALSLEGANANMFRIDGESLRVNVILDAETMDPVFSVTVICRRQPDTNQLNVIVVIVNENDNAPMFSQSEYFLSVSELTPVGTSVERIQATDADKEALFYSLDGNTNGSEFFRLASSNSPSILVAKLLDFDEGERLELIMSASDGRFVANASVHITVVDIDNRPPWFLPCDIRPGANNAKICLSAGYTGTVNLTEKEDRPLHFLPGPVYAVDGDKGLGVPINYELVGESRRSEVRISAVKTPKEWQEVSRSFGECLNTRQRSTRQRPAVSAHFTNSPICEDEVTGEGRRGPIGKAQNHGGPNWDEHLGTLEESAVTPKQLLKDDDDVFFSGS